MARGALDHQGSDDYEKRMAECLLKVRIRENDLVILESDELAVDLRLPISLPSKEAVICRHNHRKNHKTEEHH